MMVGGVWTTGGTAGEGIGADPALHRFPHPIPMSEGAGTLGCDPGYELSHSPYYYGLEREAEQRQFGEVDR